MKILYITLIFFGVLLGAFTIYAHFWGQKECKKAGGYWVSMNSGVHCVDKDFNEIDIYK